ncbi:MAG: AEC family transporter [Lachnospiraceae bacterium]|nr:AEC family transporter [Lachnospiraceae bacterium]
MLNTLVFSLNAILPLIALIVLGMVIRRLGILSDDAFRQLNRFNFRFPFCALLFMLIYNLDLQQGIPVRLAVMAMVILAVLTAIGLIVACLVTKVRGRRGVLAQSAFRCDYSIIGLPLSASLAGQTGEMIATVFQLPVVIYFNTVGVILFSIFSNSGEKVRLRTILLGIVKNPLIQGLVAGLIAVLIRGVIPVGADGQPVFSIRYTLPWLYQALNYVGRVATPLALVILGGQMRFSDTSSFRRELVTGVILKLLAAPAVGLSLMFLAARMGFLTMGPVEMGVSIALFAGPMAIASVPMAAEMGCDDKLNGQIVAWSCVIGMISLFVIITMFRAMGRL